MDLVYIPEVFSYGYSRNPQYRDYEQPWNKDYFKCAGSSRKSAGNQRTVQSQSKRNCYLCKEMKRRNLAVYIRSKSQSDSHEGIDEEEEENDVMHNERKVADADRNKSANSSRDADKP